MYNTKQTKPKKIFVPRKEDIHMKSVLKIVAVIAALAAVLGILKLTAEALSLGTHKYFEVE